MGDQGRTCETKRGFGRKGGGIDALTPTPLQPLPALPVDGEVFFIERFSDPGYRALQKTGEGVDQRFVVGAIGDRPTGQAIQVTVRPGSTIPATIAIPATTVNWDNHQCNNTKGKKMSRRYTKSTPVASGGTLTVCEGGEKV